ncbi:MAG: hypothetical protein HOG23_05510 [Flavobacteriaceae bacterium]|jgi:hypothetical protein|nr:hypothetical protein [Flavobacteriaceae bacterium]|tara:strand:- start:1585 stop:1818 length:234 start_codon:yes stop_codon:yes gene_type:complete
MSYLKLIWDFKGPSSEKIAEHHETHLKEFFILENKKLIKSGIELLNNSHHIAFAIIKKCDLEYIKHKLKPNRGQNVS